MRFGTKNTHPERECKRVGDTQQASSGKSGGISQVADTHFLWICAGFSVARKEVGRS